MGGITIGQGSFLILYSSVPIDPHVYRLSQLKHPAQKWDVELTPRKNANLKSYLGPKPTNPYGFTMVLPWFYNGFTMFLPCFYHGKPIKKWTTTRFLQLLWRGKVSSLCQCQSTARLELGGPERRPWTPPGHIDRSLYTSIRLSVPPLIHPPICAYIHMYIYIYIYLSIYIYIHNSVCVCACGCLHFAQLEPIKKS